MERKPTTLKAVIDGDKMSSIVLKSTERFKEFEQDYLGDTEDVLEGYLKDVCEYVLICHDVIRLEVHK